MKGEIDNVYGIFTLWISIQFAHNAKSTVPKRNAYTYTLKLLGMFGCWIETSKTGGNRWKWIVIIKWYKEVAIK